MYDNQQQNDPARGGLQYPTLSMEQLYHLPVHKLAKDNSILVCWVTFPKLFDQYYEKYDPISIIRSWGFRPVTTLLVWIKTNKNGALINDDTDLTAYDDYYSGLGRYTNSNAEIAIVARRGKGLERQAKNVKQVLFAPITRHSEKPQEQYRRYEQLWNVHDKQCLELFARKQNPPPAYYTATGIDYDGIDIRDLLNV